MSTDAPANVPETADLESGGGGEGWQAAEATGEAAPGPAETVPNADEWVHSGSGEKLSEDAARYLRARQQLHEISLQHKGDNTNNWTMPDTNQFSTLSDAWQEVREVITVSRDQSDELREWLFSDEGHVYAMLNKLDMKVFYKANVRFEDYNAVPEGKATWIVQYSIVGVHRYRWFQQYGAEKTMYDAVKAKFPSAELSSALEQVADAKVFHADIETPPQDIDPSKDPYNHLSCWERFKLYWWVVPLVQTTSRSTEPWALYYQLYTFMIFHQSFWAKFIHFYTIPTNVMLFFAFLAQFDFTDEVYAPFALNGGMVMGLIMIVWYMIWGYRAKVHLWGFAMIPVLVMLWMGGNLFYAATRREDGEWYNPCSTAANPLMWMYINSFIQAGSHGLEPTQPGYIVGQTHWESMKSFLQIKNWKDVLIAGVAFCTIFVIVAWISFPHLIGLETLRIMFMLGYKKESAFDPFQRSLEKACATGNPEMDYFPYSQDELTETEAGYVKPYQENCTFGCLSCKCPKCIT